MFKLQQRFSRTGPERGIPTVTTSTITARQPGFLLSYTLETIQFPMVSLVSKKISNHLPYLFLLVWRSPGAPNYYIQSIVLESGGGSSGAPNHYICKVLFWLCGSPAAPKHNFIIMFFLVVWVSRSSKSLYLLGFSCFSDALSVLAAIVCLRLQMSPGSQAKNTRI